MGNDAMIQGTVTSIGAARWNTADTPDSALRFIFRPIVVHVDEVLGGAVQESEITVRQIGGQIDNVRYVRDDLPSAHQVQPGTQLLLFLGPIVKTDDGLAARTPNFWYLVGDGVAATFDGRYQASLSDFRQAIARAQVPQETKPRLVSVASGVDWPRKCTTPCVTQMSTRTTREATIAVDVDLATTPTGWWATTGRANRLVRPLPRLVVVPRHVVDI